MYLNALFIADFPATMWPALEAGNRPPKLAALLGPVDALLAKVLFFYSLF